MLPLQCTSAKGSTPPREFVLHNEAMPCYVALLRGINVGGNNMIPMAELRLALESEGFDRVRTYIQSGNVVFHSRKTKVETLAARVHGVIKSTFGLDIAIIVIDFPFLSHVVADTPYPDEPDPRRVHVFFLPAAVDEASGTRLDDLQRTARDKGSPDTLGVRDRVIYLHTPDGFGTSDLAKALSTRGAGIHRSGTARNWATVTKLLEMCGG